MIKIENLKPYPDFKYHQKSNFEVINSDSCWEVLGLGNVLARNAAKEEYQEIAPKAGNCQA